MQFFRGEIGPVVLVVTLLFTGAVTGPEQAPQAQHVPYITTDKAVGGIEWQNKTFDQQLNAAYTSLSDFESTECHDAGFAKAEKDRASTLKSLAATFDSDNIPELRTFQNVLTEEVNAVNDAENCKNGLTDDNPTSVGAQ